MSTTPQPREWYAQIVTAMRDQVISKNLRECLVVLQRHVDFAPEQKKASRECLRALEEMKSDADLRFWIHERAAVPEAIAADYAVALALAKVRHPMTGNDSFALFVQALQQDLSLRSVMRVGLEMMVHAP